MSDNSLEVSVDSREPPDTYKLVVKQFPNAKIEQLDVGDIVYKNIAIELKTWGDFIQSIMDKRFKNQLYNFLLNTEIDGYYFIYGKWTDINKYSKIKMQAVLGAIASIQARYGLKINIYPNKQYAIYIACKIIEKSSDKKDVRPVTFRISTDDRAVNMLVQSAARFQEKAAKNALEHFGTIKDVINTSPKDLEKVKHIGKETVKRFFETINYDFKQKADFEEDFDNEFELINIDDDKVSEVNNDKKDFIADEFIGFDKKKKIVLEAIELYSKKTKKPAPLQNLLNAIKINKKDLKLVIHDLIKESMIYEAEIEKYEAY